MQKIFRLTFILISFASCSDTSSNNKKTNEIVATPSEINKDTSPADYSRFSYSLLNSSYVFQIEISGIETKVKKDAFVHQDDQYSPKVKVDGYILKVKYKMTNPYDKVIMAPVPTYYYIGTLNKEYFSASTTFHRECQCDIDNSTDLTDSKGKSIYSMSDGKCGYSEPCVKFDAKETKEFVVTFTDPIYKDATELIFSSFHRQGQSPNSTRKRDIVLVIDTESKKVIDEVQL